MARRASLVLVLCGFLVGGCASAPRHVPESGGLDPSEVDAYRSAARALDHADLERSLAAISPLTAREPWHVASHVLYQDAMTRAGRGEEAHAWYAREASEHPDDPVRGLLLARMLPEEGQARESGYRAALGSMPDSPWPRVALGHALLRRARAAWFRATALADQGFVEDAEASRDEAGATFREAEDLSLGVVERFPGFLEGVNLRVAVLLSAPSDPQESDRMAEASDLARRVAAADPGNPRAHATLAAVLRRRADDRGAREALETAFDLADEHPVLSANLGRVLLDLDEDEGAREALEHAAEGLPSEVSIHLNLGVACFRIGDLGAAREAFGHARDVAPDDPRPHEALALTHARAGDRDAAAAAMRRYVELGGREQAEGRRFIDRMAGEDGE